MKKLLTNNIGYKLLSFAAAILLWIIVVNNKNPITTKTFSNIPVTVTNSEIVVNKGNTYQIIEDTKNVSVVITAQRSVIAQITSANIKAIANMANLDPYSGSLIPVEVTVPGYNITSAEASPRNIQVNIEMESTKIFPIVPKSTGTPRDGYVVGELTVDPKEIEISGPESLVDSISQVVAEVNVAGKSKTEEILTELVFYDDDNSVIADTTLLRHNLGTEGVTVRVLMHQSKSVPIEFDISKINVAPGYVFEGITIEPKTIELVGPIDLLEGLSSVKIPADVLASNELKKTEQRTIDISPYFPGWASHTGESSEVLVIAKIHVTRKGTKTVEFATGAISLLNVPKGYKVDYGNITSVEIIVKGSDEELNDLMLEQGNVTINLIDLKEEGSYTLPLQVVLPEGLELDEKVDIEINLVKSEELE